MKRASYYGVLLIVVTLFISLYFNKEQPNDNGSSDELYLDTVYVFYSDEKEAWVINDNNWKQHPEIIEVKKVYNLSASRKGIFFKTKASVLKDINLFLILK